MLFKRYPQAKGPKDRLALCKAIMIIFGSAAIVVLLAIIFCHKIFIDPEKNLSGYIFLLFGLFSTEVIFSVVTFLAVFEYQSLRDRKE